MLRSTGSTKPSNANSFLTLLSSLFCCYGPRSISTEDIPSAKPGDDMGFLQADPTAFLVGGQTAARLREEGADIAPL